ncbi:CP2 transcription factor-domain-containing protein [Choanephora cucurbitarum]|nr:CP2 transcription factor-domain-containing protein [Choanephora cucurbitarum]
MESYNMSSPHMPMSISPSSPTSIVSTAQHHRYRSQSNSPIRFEVRLEAPTAASQKSDEPALTYLNKGQYYTIVLNDTQRYDGDINSTVSITFHDENHRMSATDYWKFWLTQQKDSDEAKAVELDLARSSGAQAIDGRMFDRVSFKWNGKQGATIHIRFNCLSTDFSRIKGVKGIPLRLQIQSEQLPSEQDIRFSQFFNEKTYCRIKLFRDKGAERKNKDDAKHIERQLEKLRGKNGEPHPFWLTYSPTLPYTLFKELVSPEDDLQPSYTSIFENKGLLQPQHPQQHIAGGSIGSPTHTGALLPPSILASSPSVPSMLPTSMKRSFSSYSESHAEILSSYSSQINNNLALDVDPTYIPQRRRRVAKLSLLVRFMSSNIFRAIYLEHLTLSEFIDKVSQRLDIKQTIVNVYRKIDNKDKSIVVKVDSEVIQDLKEEQDIRIEIENDGLDPDAVNLILHF